MKRVLSVGQCVPDEAAIGRLLQTNFEVQIEKAATADDALNALRASEFDLVLVNRKLDADYTDGMNIIKDMKADETMAAVPVMLITNFPEHDAVAVEAGAVSGFGKAALAEAETVAKLSEFLS